MSLSEVVPHLLKIKNVFSSCLLHPFCLIVVVLLDSLSVARTGKNMMEKLDQYRPYLFSKKNSSFEI
jgi:hypothetical protein